MPAIFPEPLPTEDDWFAMTASTRKRDVYAQDLYFRECWADVADIFRGRRREVLGRVAMLAFKSDGVAGRRLRPTLRYLTENGFRVVGATLFRHNRHSMRTIWQYDWHVYPVERLLLCSLMHTATPSLLVLLADTRYDGVVPGALRLSELKGPSAVAQRTPEQLRSVLVTPHEVINFVHMADEPADTVREVGVFLDRDARRALLTQVAEHVDDDLGELAHDLVDVLEREYPATDFDLENAFARLGARGVAAETVERLRAACGSGPKLTWDELVAAVDPAAPGAGVWDFVRVAVDVLPMVRPGLTGTMPAPTSADWVARARSRGGAKPAASLVTP